VNQRPASGQPRAPVAYDLTDAGAAGRREFVEPFDDENAPLYTVGQVAQMLAVKQAFLRRVDELQVVSPQRSAGGQRRYTRVEIRVIRQVATMADEGITMSAIRRIIELEQRLTEVTRERDELAARLIEILRARQRPDGRPRETEPGGAGPTGEG
jgi:MerR family transcriptional regulator, heat shock protein HspR